MTPLDLALVAWLLLEGQQWKRRRDAEWRRYVDDQCRRYGNRMYWLLMRGRTL